MEGAGGGEGGGGGGEEVRGGEGAVPVAVHPTMSYVQFSEYRGQPNPIATSVGYPLCDRCDQAQNQTVCFMYPIQLNGKRILPSHKFS